MHQYFVYELLIAGIASNRLCLAQQQTEFRHLTFNDSCYVSQRGTNRCLDAFLRLHYITIDYTT